MKKLIQGIVQFRRNVQAGYREAFGRLATGQTPDTLFIACSDSRVVPNTFASTDPGDLFVLRNVGNLIAPCAGTDGLSVADQSEAAALEFSTLSLNVANIIVCGHSECGAMKALICGRCSITSPNLRAWLAHGESACEQFKLGATLNPSLSDHNQLSQLNVLEQIKHIKSYPLIAERLQAGTLQIHGWWFDIARADVYAYEADANRFVLIDEEEAERILSRLE